MLGFDELVELVEAAGGRRGGGGRGLASLDLNADGLLDEFRETGRFYAAHFASVLLLLRLLLFDAAASR